MAIKIDETEVRKAIAVLKPDNMLFEIRHIYAGGKTNFSGYFKSADDLINAFKRFTPVEQGNTYITLNAINEACYSRKQQNQMLKNPKETTADNNIVGYQWMLVDLDPKRPSGTSSSDEELEKARLKAQKVYKYLKRNGFETPVVAMSGNGYHLLYKISLQNTTERKTLIENCLKFINLAFKDDDGVDIDTKVFNPARICKLYGTMAEKGADTKERPHRMSKIVAVPDVVKTTDVLYLMALADKLPKEPERPQKYNNYNPQQFNLEEWLTKHNVVVTSKVDFKGIGKKYILEHCPFDENHNGKDACLIQFDSGAITFKCLHASCDGRTWKDFRMFYEPDAYNRPDYKQPNREMYYRKADEERPVYFNDDEEKIEEPYFLTLEDIYNRPTLPEEFIQTGIVEIDKKLKGLKKGEVTVISGLRASGKTSITSQIAVKTAEQGYSTGIYSGEMSPKMLSKWLISQSAGKMNMLQDDRYENYFFPKKGVEEKVIEWLKDKIYIFNNTAYGDNFGEIIEQLENHFEKYKFDLIILDNLMTLDIAELGQNENQQQTTFLKELTKFAYRNNVHVIFVAHPRKASQFLRLSDISGTANIGNNVTNAFIIHRNNRDFQKLSSEYFNWSVDNDLYKSSNVIEIAKDRNGGYQDVFIPLFFEPATKRLKNFEEESTNNFEPCWNNDIDFIEVGADDVPW